MTLNEWKFYLDHRNNYKVYYITQILNDPKVIIIDDLIAWMQEGKIVPCAFDNIKLKARRIIFTITP